MKLQGYIPCKGSFTPSDPFTNVTLMGKIGMQPILPITVTVKKMEGTAHQCYGDADGVIRCEQALRVKSSVWFGDVFGKGSPRLGSSICT